jgi:hypothetical protein
MTGSRASVQRRRALRMLLPAVFGLPKAGGDWLRCDSAESPAEGWTRKLERDAVSNIDSDER